MKHTTETVATLDTSLTRRRRGRWTCRVRRSQGQRSVGPVAVVVIHEHVEDARKLLLVQDQQPVQALRANGAHEPLRHPIRLRGAERCANDLDPIASKHFVKTGREFLVSVANEEPD